MNAGEKPYGAIFDPAGKRAALEALEEKIADPELWKNQAEAKKITAERKAVGAMVKQWEQLEKCAEDCQVLLELAAETEQDADLEAELQTAVRAFERAVTELEFKKMLSGENDPANAFLSIHAGAGGTEAQDWASMLLRMYLRWAERRGFAAEIIDQMEGEEAGLKSVTVEIKGLNAFGYLRSERGVHRLVRLSPFDNAHRRHTSFVLVEAIPDVAGEIEVVVNPDDIKMDIYRSSGHGGQNVQKNSTAVRLTHIPSGIIVTCQNERSQLQNRERAMAVLKSRLYDLEQQHQEEERAKLKGEHVTAGWGNQIRSYVLHPYRMVKDLRTDWETGNTTAVLDGDIDGLIEAYLQYMVGKN